MVYFPTVIFYFTFIFCGAFGLIFGGNQDLYSQYLKPDVLPKAIENQAPAPVLSASSVLLMDDDSGSILFEKNATSSRPIASLTKLMTSLVFLEAGQDLGNKVEITKDDYRQGNQIYLNTGDKVQKKDLVNLALVASSNEAAAAMANNSGIQDFVGAMNKKAAALGLDQTVYADPTGLDPQNVSSAWNLFYLSQNAFLRQEINTAAKKSSYQFFKDDKTRITATTTDKFLIGENSEDNFKILAAKTGYLQEAGYCLLLWLENKNHRNQTLVLLGAASDDLRWLEAKEIITWAQNNYSWQ